jgi:hypothetical protein
MTRLMDVHPLTRASTARRDRVARLIWIGLAASLVSFAVQSAADLIAVLRFHSYHSIVDLDRNNAIPDLLSTVVLLVAAFGAAALAITRRQRRWQPVTLSIVLSIVALDDVLQAEPGGGWGLSVVVALGAAALLIVGLARRAPRRAAVALAIGLCLLALAVKEAYWYDQFLNHVGLGDLRRGDLEYELGIVLKQGLEYFGWSFIAVGLWASVAACAVA